MVIWTKPARDDLKSIHDYIKEDSEFYAERVVELIVEKTESLPNFPRRGRKVPEFENDSIREIKVYSYRLIYEISNGDIIILTIVHSARDFLSSRQ